MTFGLGIEEAQTTFTVHGNPTGSITTGQTTVLVPTSATCPVGPCTALVGGTPTTYTNFLLGQVLASAEVCTTRSRTTPTTWLRTSS